ncbi:hypothetical protein [Aeoliella sp.]|uniref:hypothetical protein n=1 Tax=Aeoliella sp. TaxID=2795800 RepID=UPI003CCBBCE0
MSYDLNFWKPSGKQEQEPEEIYDLLCDGQKVKGLGKMPIKQIHKLMVEAFPETEDSDPPRIPFKNGTVDVTLCANYVRFDFSGNLPKRAREVLTALMAGLGCSMFDAEFGEWYDREELVYLANSGTSELPSAINDLLQAATED